MTMTKPTICHRFEGIAPDAALAVEPFYADTGDGPEPWVRLLVDGEPFVGLPRAEFLDAWHAAIHDERGDAA